MNILEYARITMYIIEAMLHSVAYIVTPLVLLFMLGVSHQSHSDSSRGQSPPNYFLWVIEVTRQFRSCPYVTSQTLIALVTLGCISCIGCI